MKTSIMLIIGSIAMVAPVFFLSDNSTSSISTVNTNLIPLIVSIIGLAIFIIGGKYVLQETEMRKMQQSRSM